MSPDQMDERPDTSIHGVTQGGRPEAGQPGPGRVRGGSIWWLAAVGVIAVVVALAWLFGPHAR